jgi:hypothetical protein
MHLKKVSSIKIAVKYYLGYTKVDKNKERNKKEREKQLSLFPVRVDPYNHS